MLTLAIFLVSSLAFFGTNADEQENPCKSFGIDIQGGGSYFQNSLSSDPFTANQEFKGCQNDTANNVIVDPSGDQTQCSDTPINPDGTPFTVTCSQWPKNKMSSGAWSLIVISNNGDAIPIAYQRDFSLSVGPQQTETVTPTVTVTQTSTPLLTLSTTSRTTTTTTLTPATTTKYCLFCGITTLSMPALPAYTVVTKPLLTVTSTTVVPDITNVYTTTTATCSYPPHNTIADPWARMHITLGGFNWAKGIFPRQTTAPLPTGGSAKFLHRIARNEAVAEEEKAQFLAERAARLAQHHAKVVKRAPDSATITVTDANTAHYSTATTTRLAATSTITATVVQVQTKTVTPNPVTVTKNMFNWLPTANMPGYTVTNTIYVPVTKTIVTATKGVIVTVTSTIKPEAQATACKKAGGIMV